MYVPTNESTVENLKTPVKTGQVFLLRAWVCPPLFHRLLCVLVDWWELGSCVELDSKSGERGKGEKGGGEGKRDEAKARLMIR